LLNSSVSLADKGIAGVSFATAFATDFAEVLVYYAALIFGGPVNWPPYSTQKQSLIIKHECIY
jgi:hypothetical protein